MEFSRKESTAGINPKPIHYAVDDELSATSLPEGFRGSLHKTLQTTNEQATAPHEIEKQLDKSENDLGKKIYKLGTWLNIARIAFIALVIHSYFSGTVASSYLSDLVFPTTFGAIVWGIGLKAADSADGWFRKFLQSPGFGAVSGAAFGCGYEVFQFVTRSPGADLKDFAAAILGGILAYPLLKLMAGRDLARINQLEVKRNDVAAK